MKNFVAIRTKYYKKKQAKKLDDHVRRKNETTSNAYPHLTAENFSFQFKSKSSCNEEYKKITGKKTRSDFNEVFEHLGVLSLEKYEFLEKKYGKDQVKVEMAKLVKKYALEIKEKYGFEPLRFDFHLDEGHTDENGVFKRNIHFHLQFFNYDFKNKVSPLKKLQLKTLKIVDLKTGEELEGLDKPEIEERVKKGEIKKIYITNPFFSDLQDVAANIFNIAGFKRGVKRDTPLKHLEKDAFITNKQKEIQAQQEQKKAEIAQNQALIDEQNQSIIDLKREAELLKNNIENAPTPEEVEEISQVLDFIETDLICSHSIKTRFDKVLDNPTPYEILIKEKEKIYEDFDFYDEALSQAFKVLKTEKGKSLMNKILENALNSFDKLISRFNEKFKKWATIQPSLKEVNEIVKNQKNKRINKIN